MTDNCRYCSRPALLLTLLWLLTACGDRPEAPMAAGEAEYRKFCSTCHGVDGSGRPPTFPPLAGSEWLELGADATALVILLGLKGEIEVAGRTYRGYMPSMNQLSDAEIASVLDYLAGAGWAQWRDLPTPDRVAELRAASAGFEMLEGRDGLESALEEIDR